MARRTHAHDIDEATPIGERIRRIRLAKGKSLRAVAGLAGVSPAMMSRIELGTRPVDSRRLADKIAYALGVPLSSFMEETDRAGDKVVAAESMRLALVGIRPTEDPTAEPPPWDGVAGEVATIGVLRQRSDYVGVALMLSSALSGLHSHTRGPRRREALTGLVSCYRAAQATASGINARDLAVLAGYQLENVAAHLDGPEWSGLAMWTRAVGLSPISREQARTTAVAGLDQLDEHLGDLRVAEVAGTLHLSAAYTASVAGRSADTTMHLAEAERLAARVGNAGTFADFLYFSPWNVSAWATTIAVELGEGGRALEIAQTIDETAAPAPTRQAAYLIDLGRAAAGAAKTRPVAKRAFLQAEEVAPQRLHSDAYAQAAVTDLRNRARTRDPELESLAERMNIAS